MKKNGLILTYAILAILSAVFCWYQNFSYVDFGPIQSWIEFFKDAWVNAASRSLTIDLVSICISFSIFVIVKGKKNGIRYSWLYIPFAFLIAVSAAFPMFLIHLELKKTNKEI
jgi:hypothetical protein